MRRIRRDGPFTVLNKRRRLIGTVAPGRMKSLSRNEVFISGLQPKTRPNSLREHCRDSLLTLNRCFDVVNAWHRQGVVAAVMRMRMGEPDDSTGEKCPEAPRRISKQLRSLLDRTPPHQIIAALLWLGGSNPEAMARDFYSTPLGKVIDAAENTLESKNWIGDPLLREWCGIVRANLNRHSDEIAGPADPKRGSKAATRRKPVAGKTSFSDYFTGPPAENIAWWYESTLELTTVACAMGGDFAAFGLLRSKYEKAMTARINTHDHGHKNFDRVHRKMWCLAWREIRNFDPGKEGLADLFRYCADLLCCDSAAFERLYRESKVAVKGAVKKSVFIESKREEVEQEAWKRIWSFFARFDPEYAPLGAFVFYHVGNSVKDYLQQLSKASGRTKTGGVARAEPGSSAGIAPAENDPVEAKHSTDGPEYSTRMLVENGPEETSAPAHGPDHILESRERIRRVLRFVFTNFPPHETLAFGFNKPLECYPRYMVLDHWSTVFEMLAEAFYRDLCAAYFGPDREIEAVIQGFQNKLRIQALENTCFETHAPDDKMLDKALKRLEGNKWDDLPEEKQRECLDIERADEIRIWVCSVVRRLPPEDDGEPPGGGL